MTNRKQLICIAAFAALTALSNVARADDDSYAASSFNDARSEGRSEPRTCSQATQDAWFLHQLEMGEGVDSKFDVPAECQRELIATADIG